MIQQTSLKAYQSVNINKNQTMVLRVIRSMPGVCNKEIAHVLGWDINRVTPRVLELREKEIINSPGTKQYNGREVMIYM